MNFGNASSVELRSCVERAHELRREYIAQQLDAGMAVLFRLIRGLRRAAASAGGASTKPQRDSSVVMRTAREGGNSI